MRNAVISSTALYHPSRLVPNSYFNELYKQDVDTFLREKRNIHQRYFMAEDQATSDLVLPAAEKALRDAKITAADLDLIIVATDTPDYISPATAAVVQQRLQAKNAGCFDVNAACAGFVTALDIASKSIRSEKHIKNILVVGAYGMSKYLNFEDYKIATLFADGAGACVIQGTENEEEGILATHLWSDGHYFDYMGVYAGGTAKPITPERIEKHEHQLNFAKRIPPEFNSTHWPRIAHLLMDRCQTPAEEIKMFFLTQINIDSINQTMDALKVERNKSHNVMDKFGYTGSACIPMALADAANQHLLKKGDLILLIGSGGGVCMGGVLARWSYDT